MEPLFWQDRRVLVTGHTGFKGAWLCAWLDQMGAEVTGYALAPATEPALFEAANMERRVRSLIGDVRDRLTLGRAVAMARPEVVFHMAAQPIVRRGYLDPVETFTTNMLGVLNLLDACRGSSELKSIVVVTSDKCYRNQSADCGEDDPLGGSEPYGASKACAEIIASAYRASYLDPGRGVGLVTARAGNVIGGGDFAADRLIPDLMRAFRLNRVGRIRRPEAIRPWQHVLDAVAGYLTLAEAVANDPAGLPASWNFGPPLGRDCTVGTLASMLAEGWGGGRFEVEADPMREEAVLRLRPDRAERELGWHCQLSLEETVAWTIEAYRRQLLMYDSSWLDAQILSYRDRLAPVLGLPHAIAGAGHALSLPC